MLNEQLTVKAHDPYYSVGTMGLVEIGEEKVGADGGDETRQYDDDELHRHAGTEPIAQEEGEDVDEFQGDDTHGGADVGES